MIYLRLFLGFLRVGCFSFGGAYAAVPLIRDVVLANGWLNDSDLSYMIAVSESTPGPIMINLATYVGSTQAGVLGSAIATFAVVLPSFFIILAFAALMKNFIERKYVRSALDSLKPCISGIILVTGLSLLFNEVYSAQSRFYIDLFSVIILLILIAVSVLYKLFFKKKISPIALIICSAVLGICLF